MKKLLFGLAALPFLTGVAMAGQPTLLSDVQMDKVTAGDIVAPAGLITINNLPTTVTLTISNPNRPPPTVTYIISSPGFSYSSPKIVIPTFTITIS